MLWIKTYLSTFHGNFEPSDACSEVDMTKMWLNKYGLKSKVMQSTGLFKVNFPIENVDLQRIFRFIELKTGCALQSPARNCMSEGYWVAYTSLYYRCSWRIEPGGRVCIFDITVWLGMLLALLIIRRFCLSAKSVCGKFTWWKRQGALD